MSIAEHISTFIAIYVHLNEKSTVKVKDFVHTE